MDLALVVILIRVPLPLANLEDFRTSWTVLAMGGLKQKQVVLLCFVWFFPCISSETGSKKYMLFKKLMILNHGQDDAGCDVQHPSLGSNPCVFIVFSSAGIRRTAIGRKLASNKKLIEMCSL